MRVLLGAFGDPGPRVPDDRPRARAAARGHDVTLQTWARWREHVEAEGLALRAPRPSTRSSPRAPSRWTSTRRSSRPPATRSRSSASSRPDVVVADILTLAPALAAELEGVPCATLVPHVYPPGEPDFPVYSLGARLPRTALGRALWRRAQRPVARGLERGRRELNDTRAELGLAPLEHVHGGISRELALVATFPQLEYPRAWPAHVHVVGPLMWEPPTDDVDLPPGEGPLVLVAPSTAQDPDQRLLARRPARPRRSARAGARHLQPPPPARSAAGARRTRSVVEWLSYSRTMPHCDVVVCHAGHGTLVRALASGCAVVACPAVGDMNENAARLDWAGAGVRVPRRFVSPRVLRLAVERALEEPVDPGAGAGAWRTWAGLA